MTKKNARKVVARARQAKLGGSYVSHLPKYMLETQRTTASLKNLTFERIIAKCDERLMALEATSPEKSPTTWSSTAEQEVLASIKDIVLNAPPSEDKAPVMEFLRWLRIHGITQEGVMVTQGETEVLVAAEKRIQAFFEPHPQDSQAVLRADKPPSQQEMKLLNIRNYYLLCDWQVTRCVNSIERLVGIASPGEHTFWTALYDMKEAPEFAQWWKSLPKAEPYDVSSPQETILTRERFSKVFYGRAVRVVRVWLNVENYAQLRHSASDLIDPETQPDLIDQGIQGRIYNAEIRTSKKIPKGFTCIIGAHEKEDVDLNLYWVPREDQLTAI